MDELASYSFLWVIWLGVSLAIRRGEVTVITFVRDRGPVWLQRSVRTFSGISIALLLGYCLYHSTKYAFDSRTLAGRTINLGMPEVYGVISMTVGYYFISMHYLASVAEGAQRLVEQGRANVKTIISSLAGAVVIGAAVLALAWWILEAGGSPLLALGVIFVALTFAGNPIIFMLSIVGIIAVTGIAGLEFYPTPDVLFPFRTTQQTLGLSSVHGAHRGTDVPGRRGGDERQRNEPSPDRLRLDAPWPPARRYGVRVPGHLRAPVRGVGLGNSRRRHDDPAPCPGDGEGGLSEGRRGGGGLRRVDQGPDRADLDHVHPLRQPNHVRRPQRPAAVGYPGRDPPAAVPVGGGLHRRSPARILQTTTIRREFVRWRGRACRRFR